ncbi:RNA polymerase sigma factor [Porticoccaceae bacterium LTM1]|nr:RNA polymerase sigma factor [Porticoccaceae bacterium LTM1]
MSSRRSEKHQRVLEQLYRDHGEAMRCFLLGRVRNESELDDIIQEVFLRLARSTELQSRHQLSKRQNRAYLFTAANNLIVDMERRKIVRKDYIRTYHPDGDTSVYELSPDVHVAAARELSTIKEALKNLKPTWRKAFVMSRFKDENYTDIAREMGVSVRQIEKYVANAIKALRKAVPNRDIDHD